MAKGTRGRSTMLYEDVALIFEGGGMRNAYTAAVVETLLDNNIIFPKAYGISAGSALAAFYASRNPERARATFTESVLMVGKSLLVNLIAGKGVFDLSFILEGLAEENASANNEWTFNFEQLKQGVTDIHIEAFDVNSGETAAWTRHDMRTMTDALERIRASCSYPLFTPKATIDDHTYIDGGIGESHGICIDAAMRDGFERFFVVRTQMRDFRMPELSVTKRCAYKIAYLKYPKVYQALKARPQAYNALLDRVEGLRESEQAYIFCPESMPITYMTTDYEALCNAYDLGLKQCQHELPRWHAWLNGLCG